MYSSPLVSSSRPSASLPPGSCEILPLPYSEPDPLGPLLPPDHRRRRRRRRQEEGRIGNQSQEVCRRQRKKTIRAGDLVVVTQASCGIDNSSVGVGGGVEAFLCTASPSFAEQNEEDEEDEGDLGGYYYEQKMMNRALRFDSSTSIILPSDVNTATALPNKFGTEGEWERIYGVVQEINDIGSDDGDVTPVGNERTASIGVGGYGSCSKCVEISRNLDDADDAQRTGASIIGGVYVLTTATAPMRPKPLLSLSLRRIRHESNNSTTSAHRVEQPLSPLMTACLKRVMVGRPLVHGSTTVVNLPQAANVSGVDRKQRTLEVQLCAESAIALRNNDNGRSSGTGTGPFIVVPSTRITISDQDHSGTIDGTDGTSCSNETENASASTINKGTPYLSSAAKMLVEIIRSVRLLATTPTDKVSSFFGTSYPPVTRYITRSILLSGPPGVGKTHSVRLACFPSEAASPSTQLISLRGSDLLSNHPSAAGAARELARIFNAAAEYAGKDPKNVAVIFMDECDALMGSNACVAMLASLLDKMDGSPVAVPGVEVTQSILASGGDHDIGWFKVVVIAATNRIDALPAFLRRPGRFDKEICVSPPNANERMQILNSLLESCRGGKVDIDIDMNGISDIAEACVGYVAADLASLVRRAATLSLEEYVYNENDKCATRTLSTSHLRRAMADVGASALRDAALAAPPKTTWDDIAGDAGGAKTALRRAIEWPRTKKDDFARLGLVPPRGVLLYGPPGTGKTLLARAAAGSAGIAFLSLSPADVYASSYVGEAEAIVRRAFSLARSASPCVLFFDEIDSIIGSEESGGGHGMGRGGRGSSAEARVLSTFLNEMDGVDGSVEDGVLVLGATNRPSTLDAALLRPGRFDKVIYVPPPDKVAREAILRHQCQKWKQSSDGHSPEKSALDIDTEYLASDEITGLMTGAEIVGACREAAMRAIRDLISKDSGEDTQEVPRVTQEQLLAALNGVHPLLADKSLELEYSGFDEAAHVMS